MYRTFIAIALTALAFIPSAQGAQSVEADNGAVYRILQTIHSRDGTAQAQISTPDGDVMNFVFDCRGHMASFSGGGMRSIPPRSVGGRIAQIACTSTLER